MYNLILLDALNRQWYLRHKMPANATLEQRIKWHLAHVRHCACGPIPDKLMAEIRKRSC
ncbi:MAG: hypothetical protein AB1599_09580 [Planctomycetota bacterium]